MTAMRFSTLEALLRRRGSIAAGEIATELGVSQPTVSRLIAQAGERVVRIGRGRATRYALAHEIGRAGSHWPLYRIDAEGRPQALGTLHALHGDGFWFDSAGERPAFLHDEFRAALFPGLPWFIDDQRPQGFLGRAFGRRVAADIDAPGDILAWRNDDVVAALLRHGDDEPGDLVLGEAALQRALRHGLAPPDVVQAADRARAYPRLAEQALAGELAGSSVGGEQPKFAVTVRDGSLLAPVIVKFSDRIATPAGRRWADLLIAEQLAGEVLREAGLDAAHGEFLLAEDRGFLQSTRFDRTPALGRRGFVSLAALDAAFFGHGRIDWWRFAPQLQRSGWLTPVDARRLRLYGWFGALIGNSDMHLGNAALHLADERPLRLTPAWDMLPMLWRPAASGEVVARELEVILPAPEQREDWIAAATLAQAFWRRLADDSRVSAIFRSIAAASGGLLQRASARV